jgi:antitoxin ParD1/3/4
MPTRNVALTDQQDSPVDRLVRSGCYQNAGEELRESSQLVERDDAENGVRIEALRDAARVGIADVKAGRIQSFPSAEELDRHFGAIATSAIASAHEHDGDVESQGDRKDVPPNT